MSKSNLVEKKIKNIMVKNVDIMSKIKMEKVSDDAYEGQKDLIDIVIYQTRREQMSDTKVYIHHPRYRRHCCDIFGGVYKFNDNWKDPKRLVIYNDYIFIELKNDVTIQYKYMNFKRECFNLPVKYYHDKFIEEDDSESEPENDSENYSGSD